MFLWLLVLSPLMFLVSRWARRSHHLLLRIIANDLARIAGRLGRITHVQLTSVLVDGQIMVIGYQGATPTRPATQNRLGTGRRHRHSLVVSIDATTSKPGSEQRGLDAANSIAALREWEAKGVAVVMWRDRTGSRVELSLPASGQRVALLVDQDIVATRTGDLTRRMAVAGD